MNTILGLGCGVVAAAAGNAGAFNGELNWWQWMIVSLVPTIIGGVFDIIVLVLKKKGYLEKEDAAKLEEKYTKKEETAEKAEGEK